jgi:E3 ubiquitin-protein ligase HUWE1
LPPPTANQSIITWVSVISTENRFAIHISQSSGMEIDQSADGTPVAGPSSVAATTAATTISPEAPSTPAPKQSSPTTKPPQIPEEYLRSIIMPLYMAQCSNKTFRHILAIIEHISVLPGARQIFLQQLTQSTTLIIPLCTADLDSLLALLNVTEEDIKIQQLTLESFTPSNSSQAKLLRILKTIDYIYTIKKTAVPASKSTHKNSLADSNDTVERMMNRLIGAGMLRGRQSSDSPTPSEASFVVFILILIIKHAHLNTGQRFW